MNNLTRTVKYKDEVFPNYEVCLKTGVVKSKKTGRPLTIIRKEKMQNRNTVTRPLEIEVRILSRQLKHSNIMASTFPDLIKISPLVTHFGLQDKLGYFDSALSLLTPTEYIMNCKAVVIDHIDSNCLNYDFDNLQKVTSFENSINRVPSSTKKYSHYKGVYKIGKKWMVNIQYPNIITPTGEPFSVYKRFDTEIEAAIGYNKLLEQSLKQIFGLYLGQYLYSNIAYKNVILPENLRKKTNEQQLNLDLEF